MENINNFTETIPQNAEVNTFYTKGQEHYAGLSSAEIANLWSAFMISSIQECIIKYLQRTVEDQQINSVLDYARETAQQQYQKITEIFKQEKHPIPEGFTGKDVNLDAPRLFTDSFILSYLEKLAHIRINGYSTALPMTARKDVLDFFNQCYISAAELYNKTASVMLSKGLYIRPPYISPPEKVDFVKKQNYLTGFFGDRRPLNAIEISHIFNVIKFNDFRKAILTGFGQVSALKVVRDYMLRGKDITEKHIQIFSRIMAENDLPVSMNWDFGITDSTTSPFSDKLMMQHIRVQNLTETSYYGKAFAACLRHDLSANFSRLMLEKGKYAEEGINIMIDNGWLEETPQALDRDALAKKIQH